jgi:hypothetical protein
MCAAGQTERVIREYVHTLVDVSAMGRFYFHLKAGDQLIPDEEGLDLPNLWAAHCEALWSARELVANAIRSGKPQIADAFLIADEDGRELETVPFAAALPKAFTR